MQTDRSLEFHTPGGCHYSTRLPRYGRDLKYNLISAEALIPAVGLNENGAGEVFRINLDLGRYMRSFQVEIGSTNDGALQGAVDAGSVNVAAIASTTHNLLAFGTSLGTTEFWDPRSRIRTGLLQPPPSTDSIDGREEITAIEFSRSGLGIATGSSTGLIRLYDLRSPHPILKKDQGYGYPIHTITYLDSSTVTRAQSAEPKILSSDKRIIKIWDSRDGSPWTSVEPAVDINSVAWCKDSGMLLTANEGRQQHSFFIPQLGPAPKWCSFLDNLVEEMAEDPNDPSAFSSRKAGDVYDNYKFLTLAQLETLNLSHLIGTTSLLRPYMHGYFVAQRLYEEAKLIADPFVWGEQRNKQVKEKIDAERDSRIRGNKNISAKVNQRLAKKMLDRQEREERRQARRALGKGEDAEGRKIVDPDTSMAPGDEVGIEDEEMPARPENLLADARFAKLFADEAFAIDETSREFQLLNPSTKYTTTKPTLDGHGDTRKLTAVEEEALSSGPASDSEGSVSSQSFSNLQTQESVSKPRNDNDRISSNTYKKAGHRSQQQQPQRKPTQEQPNMKVYQRTLDPRKSGDRSFGSRASQTTRQLPSGSNRSTIVGEREIQFAPEARKNRKQEQQDIKDNDFRVRKRRDKDRRSASGNVFRNM